MFIHAFIDMARRNSRLARSRRQRPGPWLQLESLENRTPLSTGIAGVAVAPAVLDALETGLRARVPTPAVEWATFEAGNLRSSAAAELEPISAEFATTPPPTSNVPASNLLEALATLTLVGTPGDVVAPPLPPAALDPIGVAGVAPMPNQASVYEVIAERTPDAAAPPIPNWSALSVPPGYLGTGDFEGGMPPNPAFGILMTLEAAPWRIGAQMTNNQDETDMSFAGTLENIETMAGNSQWMNIPLSTGHASGRPWSIILSEPLVQIDSSTEGPGTSGLSYLASAEWSNLELALSAAAIDNLFAWEDGPAEPVAPASITAGGISVNVLLGSPDLSMIPADPRGVEQVVELVPLPESSLALAATLWTVSSGPSEGAARSIPVSDDPADQGVHPGCPPAWAVFMTGMDQALIQACRDIEEGITSGREESPGGLDQAHGPRGLIEWQGPIMPAARVGSPVKEPGPARPGTPNLTHDNGPRRLQSREKAQPESDGTPGVVLGAMPVLSIVSLSTLVAGWLWRQRRQLRRLVDGGDRTGRARQRACRPE